ncbi:MAG: glucose/sorbosone dehydrogenase-like protein [Solirubrobacterales bacterium]|nr:glucose/sorbosone dehydrogenase-like protein [Solirubrobacterales bacterium]
MVRSRLYIAALVVVAGLGGALGTAETPKAATGGFELRRLGSFEMPTHIAEVPGKRRLLVVVEKPGTIRVRRDGKVLKHPFLDLSETIRLTYEEGLLSIAFDPHYEENRRFFVYYVGADGDLHLDAFRRKPGSATRAAPHSRREVLEIPHPRYASHNGGQLQFGPDGMLYLGTGDGGGNGDPGENAQDPESLLGKLLRIDPQPMGGYVIPASNPFVGRPGRDEIYALGLRNPWRFSFDRANGDLTIGDVGENLWEEIDHLPLEAARGANFGWDNLEGNEPFEDPGMPPLGYVPPIHVYDGSAVIAGYVVRDRRLPNLFGQLLYADLSRGRIRSIVPDAPNPSRTDAPLGPRVSGASSFAEGAHGRLYVTSINGSAYRIVPRRP